MKAGEVTLRQKNNKLSRQYNLGALAELEKMALNKKRMKPTAKEQKFLRFFPSIIEAPFMLSNSGSPLGDIGELMKTSMQFQASKKLLQQDMNKLSTDPGANSRMKDTAAKMQQQAQKMQEVSTRYPRESMKRSHRVYRAYQVLLGANNPATVYAKKQYKKSRKHLLELENKAD